MGKQGDKKKTRRDVVDVFGSMVEKIIDEKLSSAPMEPPKPNAEDTRNPAAVALSKLGASKGGKARAVKLSAERRKQIAQTAAAKRWGYSESEPSVASD